MGLNYVKQFAIFKTFFCSLHHILPIHTAGLPGALFGQGDVSVRRRRESVLRGSDELGRKRKNVSWACENRRNNDCRVGLENRREPVRLGLSFKFTQRKDVEMRQILLECSTYHHFRTREATIEWIQPPLRPGIVSWAWVTSTSAILWLGKSSDHTILHTGGTFVRLTPFIVKYLVPPFYDPISMKCHLYLQPRKLAIQSSTHLPAFATRKHMTTRVLGNPEFRAPRFLLSTRHLRTSVRII